MEGKIKLVHLAKDFVEYVQRFGSISVGSIELCGIDEDPECSTVDRTLEMRDLFSDFPMDCYVIESVGIDNAVMVQKSDGKISYDEEAEDISAHIFINCDPDYFADHSIEVYMDSKGNIDVIGLAG